MDNTTVLNTVKEIISKVTGLAPEELDSDAYLIEDIGMSSIELTTVVSELEKKFHVSISTQDLRKVVRLKDLAELLESRK